LIVARIGSANQSIKPKRKGPNERKQEKPSPSFRLDNLYMSTLDLGRDDLKYALQKQSKAGCARTADEEVGSFYPIINVSLCQEDLERTVATSSLKQKFGKFFGEILLRKTKFPKEY
jgi:hypothetical protein